MRGSEPRWFATAQNMGREKTKFSKSSAISDKTSNFSEEFRRNAARAMARVSCYLILDFRRVDGFDASSAQVITAWRVPTSLMSKAHLSYRSGLGVRHSPA